MRRTTVGLIAFLALLAACKVEPPTSPLAKRSQTPATRAGDPTAAPDVAPGKASPIAPASAKASQGLAQTATLTRPALPVKVVTGKVLVDANYLVAAGAGNILSHNGGLIVAAGGGNILSQNGGQVISHNGGLIVAAGAGNVIVNNSGNMVAAGAGNIISQNGGQLVAAGGGLAYGEADPRAARDGGSGGNYALAQATAAPASVAPATAAPASPAQPGAATPAPGTQLPAAGMELRARSLRDGRPLPLGLGPDGQPVYAIYTNAAGGYAIFLPDSEVGNVLLEARVPAQTDARLTLDALTDTRQPASNTPASPGVDVAFGAEVNEVNAIVTRYIRTCLVGRFVEVCQREDIAAIVDNWGADASAVAVVAEFVRIYRGLSVETGLVDASPADAEQVARRCLDVVLAKADLPGVVVPNGIVADMVARDPEPGAVAEIVDVVAFSRDRVAAKLAADPGFLATWPFKAERMVGFKPVKASDPADFVVGEYLNQSGGTNIENARDVFQWSGALDPRPGQANNQVQRLNTAAVAMTMYMAGLAVYDEDVKAGCAAAFRAWQAGRGAASAAPAAGTSPAPTATASPAS